MGVERTFGTSAIMTEVKARTTDQVPCDVQAIDNDKLSTSLWIPFVICCVYLGALRQWYLGFKDSSSSGNPFESVSFIAPAIATIVYLLVIFGLKKVMASRPPCNLKDYMFTYNLYQTVLNLWCVFAFVKEVLNNNMSIWGNRVDNSSSGFQLGFLIWVHYNNKYVELLDTVFMALRKKNNQISFLHVYHHVLLIWSWFAVCKLACGGDAYFGALCNSFVHVLMYSYYLLALLKIDMPWKKYLTSIQMVQFMLCFAHSVYVLWVGNVPPTLGWLQMWVMANMLVLFGNFYAKTYSKKSVKKTE
eukprot:c15894_g1_i1.p1 GENE.c15894_g1_i1~~c15894_g1_i1.p1  ORF type:complete len:303 (-),score=39.91 c15894_g1_i1:17-925(-)